MVAIASVIVAAALGACALVEENEIALDAPLIRMRDVVTLDCLPEVDRERVGDLIISNMDRDVALRREGIAALVRRRVPMLSALSGDARVIRFSRPPSPQSEQICAVAARAIGQGEAIGAHDVARSACVSGPIQTRYDRLNGIARAATDLPVGAPLGAIPPMAHEIVEVGTPMTIIVEAGPVSIQRQVYAAQSARAGDRLFVQDGEGAVFAVDFPETASR